MQVLLPAVAIPVIYLGLESLLSPQRAIQNTKSLLLSQFQQRLKSVKPKGFEDPRLAPLLDSEVTPTDLFYRIDKNALVPQVNLQTWNLKVTGLVNRPLTLDYPQIKSMVPVEQFATLECVSNKIGGDLISTCRLERCSFERYPWNGRRQVWGQIRCIQVR